MARLERRAMMVGVLGGSATLALAAPGSGQLDRLAFDSSLVLDDRQVELENDESVVLDLDEPSGRLTFGEAGAWYWSLGGGVGFSDDSIDSMAQVSIGTFLTDDFEFNLALRGWYFAQDGPDAAGGSAALGFRWHFVQEETYSIYTHVGIGILEANEDVPPGGTQLNFTPTIGLGSTIRLGDSTTRLDIGARWHHISNATISGSDDNPARDGIMLYMGLIFPF